MIESLIEDNLIEKSSYLNDKEKRTFLSINTIYHLFKNKITINRFMNQAKIKHLSYYNSFTNIYVQCDCIDFDNFPSKMTHLCIDTILNMKITKNFIPSSVTHLMFRWNFNQKIDNLIPHNVTHLNIQ